uniref:DUF6146 family protein n=1 Tax=Flavobacterium sp. TaxID=239 RepID=UPI00404B045A
MKKIAVLLGLVMVIFFGQCVSKKANQTALDKNINEEDLVVIENDSLEYKIIIFEPGFNSWLNGTARPRDYYNQSFLEQRNMIWVQMYNMRVGQPLQYNPDLYPFTIEYRSDIDYGYEVNYLLYNYFVFFQLHYNQKLGTFIPRI